MKKVAILFFYVCSIKGFAQNNPSDAFQRISTEMKNFTVDTSAVPNDSLSDAIRKLRSTKGGFNITEAVEYKIAEDLNKGDLNKATADKLTNFYTQGNGKRWLENAVVWIYRKQFTLPEVNELVLFYQSPVGKKMSQNFPVVMLQSMKAAEQIIEQFKKANIK